MKQIKTLEEIIKSLVDEIIDIPDGKHLAAVFEDNESTKIIGWTLLDTDNKFDGKIYSLEELIKKFEKK